MGSCQAKEKGSSRESERVVEGLKNKVTALQTQLEETMRLRDAESQAYGRDLMLFSLNHSHWKTEKQRLEDEVHKQQTLLKSNTHSQIGGDETVETKWKNLYFAIKDELDHLILRTHQEERVWWNKEKEEVLWELKNEVKARGLIIETLEAKIAKMEEEESKREREMDILRQSLRIMSHSRAPTKLGQKAILEFRRV